MFIEIVWQPINHDARVTSLTAILLIV